MRLVPRQLLLLPSGRGSYTTAQNNNCFTNVFPKNSKCNRNDEMLCFSWLEAINRSYQSLMCSRFWFVAKYHLNHSTTIMSCVAAKRMWCKEKATYTNSHFLSVSRVVCLCAFGTPLGNTKHILYNSYLGKTNHENVGNAETACIHCTLLLNSRIVICFVFFF